MIRSLWIARTGLDAQQRDVRYVMIPASRHLDKVTVSDDEVKAYHARENSRFLQPEQVDALAKPMLVRVRTTPVDRAEFARTGRYYATESMLVWDATRGRYDAEATPSAGHDTLRDYYARLLAGTATLERGDHAVF